MWDNAIDAMRETAASMMCSRQLELLRYRRDSVRPRIILLMSPEYRNYGDIAIALGALRWLTSAAQRNHCELIELSNTVCCRWASEICCHISKKDILVFTGGGYMGDLWADSQSAVEELLRLCPDNPVLLLPQSIYYQDKENPSIGVFRELLCSRTALLACAREDNTLQFLTDRMGLREGRECLLVPDCALLLDSMAWRGTRSNALICLRSDCEANACIDYSQCRRLVSEEGLGAKRGSTVGNLAIPLPLSRREKCLSKRIRPFQRAEVVITDRLHATILSALSATPVVAFDNVSGKVSGVVSSWLSGLAFVEVVNSADEAKRALSSVLKVGMEERLQAIDKIAERVSGEYLELEAWLRDRCLEKRLS